MQGYGSLDFLVIDTEGKPELREIAILDHQGELVYEAFNADHPSNDGIRFNLKPLSVIIQEVAERVRHQRVVFHSAQHDLEVLQFSFLKAKLPWQNLTVTCTWELAKLTLPNLDSYSLEYLSKFLQLKVRGKLFNPVQAHTARYDAEFTHQLYLKLLDTQQKTVMRSHWQNLPNPFTGNRVDTPFQDHIDFQEVYRDQFQLLTSVLGDIKRDPNQQSRGAVVIGPPGSGKTHLIMRMAKERLRTNRLLFIRQPNNADAVLYHTYSRILESLAERVEGKEQTQLELLLAHAFVKILATSPDVVKTATGQKVLAELQDNSLRLYDRLGNEETQRHSNNWQYIERHISEWWKRRYAAAGYSAAILQGIFRFCRYQDPRKKDLARRWLAGFELEPEDAQSIGLLNWQDDISKEDFALEAIAVFGKLSTLDEPLIIVFDQLEGLGLEHNRPILNSFGSAVKEIMTHVPHSLIILNLFPNRWQEFQEILDGSIVDRVSEYQVILDRPTHQKLEQILSLKTGAIGIALKDLFSIAELNDILRQDSIRAVLNRAAAYFRYKVNQIPLPSTPSPVARVPEDLEARVQHLEQVMQQIATLVQPYVGQGFAFTATTPGAIADVSPPITTPTGWGTALNPEFSNASGFQPTPPEEIIAEYLKQQRAELRAAYSKPTIITEANDIGKLNTIVEAFKEYQAIESYPLRLGRKKLPENLCVRTARQTVAIAFLHLGGSGFTTRLKNWNELVIEYPEIQFRVMRDVREPAITGAVGQSEMSKLNHTANGSFDGIDQEDRLNFELSYNLIIAIQEKDLDVDLAIALPILAEQLKGYWLIDLLSNRAGSSG